MTIGLCIGVRGPLENSDVPIKCKLKAYVVQVENQVEVLRDLCELGRLDALGEGGPHVAEVQHLQLQHHLEAHISSTEERRGRQTGGGLDHMCLVPLYIRLSNLTFLTKFRRRVCVHVCACDVCTCSSGLTSISGGS